MQQTTLDRQQDSRLFFPRIARGHGQSIRKDKLGNKGNGCKQACQAQRRMEASFTDKGGYTDGHFQTQDVALRAHQEGYR